MKNLSFTSSSDSSCKPTLLRFFAGVLLVAALAAAGQYAIDAFWPPEFPPAIRNMPRQCGNTFVFLGDSINASFARDDENPRTLATLVSLAADHHIGAVALGGYDMRLFRDYVRAVLPRVSPDNPRTWIFTVNLSNYRQDGRVPWIRNKTHIALLRQYLHRTLRAFARPMRIFQFPAYRPDIRADEDARRPVLWQGRFIGRNRDFPDTRFKIGNVTDDLRRENVILRYGQPLSPGNLNLRATAEAARLLRRFGQRAIFCIMPCDVQRCDALLGGAISPILDEKAATVAAAARDAGGEVLDMHNAYPDEYFIQDQYPNEHLRNAGRSALASAIADFIRTNSPTPLP
jgi:hypothetical protein